MIESNHLGTNFTGNNSISGINFQNYHYPEKKIGHFSIYIGNVLSGAVLVDNIG